MGYTINTVGGDSDKGTLLNYQILPVANSNPTLYNFCTPAPASTVVVTDPTSFTNGQEFKFDLALSTDPSGKKYKWKIKNWNVGTTNTGDWDNDHKQPEYSDVDDGEKGTFTLQSGMEEDARTAGAS